MKQENVLMLVSSKININNSLKSVLLLIASGQVNSAVADGVILLFCGER